MGHQVFAQEPPGVVVADAEHGAEFREGHHIRVGTETLFIILSCHDWFSFSAVHVAHNVRRYKADVFPTAEDLTRWLVCSMAHNVRRYEGYIFSTSGESFLVADLLGDLRTTSDFRFFVPMGEKARISRPSKAF